MPPRGTTLRQNPPVIRGKAQPSISWRGNPTTAIKEYRNTGRNDAYLSGIDTPSQEGSPIKRQRTQSPVKQPTASHNYEAGGGDTFYSHVDHEIHTSETVETQVSTCMSLYF
jgi:hypothetical protein